MIGAETAQIAACGTQRMEFRILLACWKSSSICSERHFAGKKQGMSVVSNLGWRVEIKVQILIAKISICIGINLITLCTGVNP